MSKVATLMQEQVFNWKILVAHNSWYPFSSPGRRENVMHLEILNHCLLLHLRLNCGKSKGQQDWIIQAKN